MILILPNILGFGFPIFNKHNKNNLYLQNSLLRIIYIYLAVFRAIVAIALINSERNLVAIIIKYPATGNAIIPITPAPKGKKSSSRIRFTSVNNEKRTVFK